MRDLKRERERLGLSRESVAASARVPLRSLAALEDGTPPGSPPPPFLTGYRRKVEAWLDAQQGGAVQPGEGEVRPYVRPEPEAAEAEAPAPEGVPIARLVIGGFVATLAVVLVFKVGAAALSRPPAPPTEPEIPVQKVELRAIEPTRVAVRADGKTLFSGTLEPGAAQTFEGRGRLEVDTSDLTRVSVRHNGERLEPLGNLSSARRLVFIQEAE